MILVFPFRRRRHGQYTDGVNGNQDRFGQQPVGLVPIHESRAYTSIKWQGSLVQGRFPPESEQPMILVQLGSSPNWQPTTSRAGQFPARIRTAHDFSRGITKKQYQENHFKWFPQEVVSVPSRRDRIPRPEKTKITHSSLLLISSPLCIQRVRRARTTHTFRTVPVNRAWIREIPANPRNPGSQAY